MSIKCPDCGHINRDGMAFCEECGEPIDPKTRLIMELEGKKKTTPVSEREQRRTDDDDVTLIGSQKDDHKRSPIGWILAIACAAALVYLFFLR